MTYGDCYRRVSQLAHLLGQLGIGPGDRVGTLAWNHHRHAELYFGVPAVGAVLHTLNLRLHADDLAYVLRHAGDKVAFVDSVLLPQLLEVLPQVPSVQHVVVLDGEGTEERALSYETLMAGQSTDFTFEPMDENAAAVICYTSGTTGRPKGVVYSHRSTVLHTLVLCLPDVMGIQESDRLLPAVPMFHANAWGLPFACAMTGADLVLPGRQLDPESVLQLIAEERVTVAAGVPTIWLRVLALLQQHPGRWDVSCLRHLTIAGSAVPQHLFDGFARLGVHVAQLWGMTEMNPLGAYARVKKRLGTKPEKPAMHYRLTQGFAVPLVEQRHVSEQGEVLPWDGQSVGELQVRGPWVAASYLGRESPERFTEDGWLRTGDVVTICPEGYLSICDRAKDVIKSGGEWISSVALENALMAHPAVLEAAVFAATHPTWVERPVAAVVFRPGQHATDASLRTYLSSQFAKFWLPDAYLTVEQIPRTSTGKFQKRRLRELYGKVLL